jgi:hypothetical protein
MRQGVRGVHAPTEYEIAIHLKAARVLGFEIPATLYTQEPAATEPRKLPRERRSARKTPKRRQP